MGKEVRWTYHQPQCISHRGPSKWPSCLFLGTSIPTCFSSKNLSINPWSPKNGNITSARPNWNALVTELQPQYVKKPPTDSWAKIFNWGPQPIQTIPRSLVRSSNSFGNSTESPATLCFLRAQKKDNPDCSSPRANSVKSSWLGCISLPSTI